MHRGSPFPQPRSSFWLDGEMAELPLLLPGRMAEALEAAASRRGLTVAQMVRRLIRAFLAEAHPGEQPAEDEDPVFVSARQ
jgi:hypothetical protein